MLEDRLQNACDRFFVSADRLQIYGKNCSDEAFANAVYLNTDKVLKECRKAMKNIRRASLLKGNPGRLFEEELYLIEEAYESLGGVSDMQLRGWDGVPSVLSLCLAFVRCGDLCTDPLSVMDFIAGAESGTRLTFSELTNFSVFVRMALVLYLGEIARRRVEMPRELDNALTRAEERFREGSAPSAFDRRAAAAESELHRGLEEQARIYLRTLRAFRDKKLGEAVMKASVSESLLKSDPAGVYHLSSDRTKAYVRACTQKIAKRSGMDEEAVIRQALKAADSEKGVIDKLTEHPCIVSKRKSGAAVWFICELGLPVLLSGLTAMWGNIPSAVLSLLLWHEIVLTMLNTVFPRFIFPRELCAFEFKNGVPKEFATLCVISLLGDSAETSEKYARKLEKIYLSNRDTGDEIKYGLLMDLPDSQNQKTAGDGEIISEANSAVDRLNRRYGDRFCVITREREFSRSEGKYIAPERKRGAITELAALMNGKPNSLLIGGLTRETAAACRYILTLDADTEAYPGSLKELIASAAHPQNRPQISSNGTVVSGYGIIKPRIDVELNSANRSLFARIFSGQGGTDRYSSPLSDTLWCLTGTSDFTGKGIIDARAMDKVLSGRLPREKILSHDILEGGCLRCGYAHGAEFLDGFPATVRGYYKRLGRWTRGDIQLLPWTSISVSSENGEKIINPVKPVTRLRIALNAVRSLFAACVFLSVVLFAFGLKGFGISFVTALVCLGMQLLTNILARIQRPSAVAVRRYADVYTGWRGGVMLFFSRVVFLPYEAWVSIRSAFTALWRMAVSKKKLLEWVTAAEGDRHSPTGALKTYFAMMSSVIAAAVTVIIGMDTAALALAVIWILAPLYGAYLSVPLNEEKRVGSRGKKLLTDHCWKMEHYVSSLRSSGYILPPDNYQEMPFIGWADRTSPTNIGFCFLSAVASAELGLIKRDTALERCEKLYAAVSALEKYRGNLYNWYSCSEAKPLEPRYISSVDSGNFAACAAATAEVLRSWKEPSSLTLGDKLEKMWRETDLSVFYDRDKKLMAIGLDGEKRRLGGFYDMLASEARLTSFIAIAKGDVPGDHWSALSRIMTKSSGYGGLASWSGSLFEYLMPFILLPSKEGSLLAESADFAIGTQRRRGAKMGVPWGVSECCYLGFDPAMNYQYKAHGDPSLAVGSGAGEEYAASPYSTYLSLARSPEKACKNLDCFSELGLYGSFGMCDSVDFTLSRLPDDLDRAAVRTYMTHHIGMSLCSAVNLLCENVLVKAFMSVPDFCAVDQLLCERIPETAPRKLPGKYRAGKKRDEPGRSSEHEFMFTGWERDFPPSAILSNLSWTAVVAADGRNRSTVGDRVIYRSDIGFMTAVKQGDKCLFLKNGPGKEGEKRTFYTGGDSAVWKLGFGHTSVREHVSIVRNINAEKHTIEVSTKDREEIYIAVYLEPQLCSDRRYSSHPEFERLKMRVDLNGGEKIALVKRRDSVGGDVFLALSWSCDAEGFSVSRSDVLGRSGGRDPEVFFENVLKKERSDGEPCLYLLFRIVPSEGVTSSVSLALGFSSEEETAVRNSVEALKSERRGRAYQTAVNKAGLDKD
ncbi:MAG: hypothetical protein IKZ19_09620, partial [Clostridia bacterium]|nr:hypothetical protein [Clostridia bacterium]